MSSEPARAIFANALVPTLCVAKVVGCVEGRRAINWREPSRNAARNAPGTGKAVAAAWCVPRPKAAAPRTLPTRLRRRASPPCVPTRSVGTRANSILRNGRHAVAHVVAWIVHHRAHRVGGEGVFRAGAKQGQQRI